MKGPVVRLAVVGADGDHAAEFLRILNAERRCGPVAISHVWTSGSDLAPGLAARFDLVVEADLDRLSTCVEGALVLDRDGSRHLAHARPFLERGMPVFVDKPLACSLAEADELVATARRHGAVLVTGSALRWQPGLEPVVEAAAACAPLHLTVSGPADPRSPHGGGFFYGSHIVELLMELSRRLTGATTDLRHVATTPQGVVLGGRLAGVELAVHLLESQSAGYDVEVQGRHGRVSARLELDDDYMVPVARTFAAAIDTGTWPMSPDEVLAPVRALVEYQHALDRARNTARADATTR